MELSDAARQTAGILLLTITAVELGGAFLLRIVGGRHAATELQRVHFRAGHAHAGVFVTLALAMQPLADAADLDGLAGELARRGVPLAAILLPAGFFLSVARQGATTPNRLFLLIPAGAVALAAGVVSLGAGLLAST
jgi:hypothetical protein